MPRSYGSGGGREGFGGEFDLGGEVSGEDGGLVCGGFNFSPGGGGCGGGVSVGLTAFSLYFRSSWDIASCGFGDTLLWVVRGLVLVPFLCLDTHLCCWTLVFFKMGSSCWTGTRVLRKSNKFLRSFFVGGFVSFV